MLKVTLASTVLGTLTSINSDNDCFRPSEDMCISRLVNFTLHLSMAIIYWIDVEFIANYYAYGYDICV